jgi:CHAT domain-containing protein
LEAAEGLNDVSARLMAVPDDEPDGARFRAEGLGYRATATCCVASVLSTAGDQPSLERALEIVDETLGLLRKAPQALVERTNIAHVEACAALQLGDPGRAREAVERGVTAARRIKDDYQVKFFSWADRVAELIADRPAVVRSLPELQYELAVADGGPDTALQSICATLQREMATDITSTTTIERLSLAARILEGSGASETLLAAAEGLMDLKRLLVSGRSDLQIGQDDSLLFRNVAADRVAHLADAGDYRAAVLAADRARARTLLAGFVLSPGETEGLREVVAEAANPGQAMLIEAAATGRIPEGMRRELGVQAPWSGPGPLGVLHASAWLRRHAGETRRWADQLLAAYATRSLTATELLDTVRALGHPVLVLHPTNDRIGLFLIVPDGTIHHAASAMTASDIQQHAGAFHRASTARAEFHAAARAIYDALIAPLKPHLAEFTSLTVSPYRDLSAIPFALAEDRGRTPFVERCAVSVVPSIATLSLLRARATESGTPGGALVVGDPATTRLPRLPGAASEAHAVEARLRAAHADMPLELLLDTDATPSAVLQRARGARLLHLACHAVADDSAQQAALYLAPDGTGDDRLDRTDVVQAPLDDALVFLSACRSGGGRAAAEGTLGLAREFLRAGARAVVASHWNVPDDVTAMLVEHFYTSFIGSGRDVATALRMAMRAAREDLERTRNRSRSATHPAAWGGFFVLGDGTLRDQL